MKRILSPLLALALVSVLVLPAAAQAFLVHVTFEFPYDPRDPVNAGETASGTFAFDGSLLRPYGEWSEDFSGLGATSIDFLLDGHTWTRGDADLTELHICPDPLGLFWSLDTMPYGGYAPTNVPMFDLLGWGVFDATDGRFHGRLEFHYTTSNSPELGVFMGNGSWTAGIPEAGTLSLLVLGLLPLGLLRARRR
ncbi:MAG TPA: hypothetical protein VFS09_06105 [Candidatus Eisenbacteria bacterium]|nr:hypothetical protein [Candidatus Eisenbacteria bacterium]